MLPTFDLVILAVLLILLFCLAFLNASHVDGCRALSCIALIGYTVTILYVTILTRTPVLETRRQLIPFYQFDLLALIGMLENAILFLPAGALLLATFSRLHPLQGMLGGAALSMIIELIQLFSHRGITDIDDLIANVVGAVLGVFFFTGVQKLVQRSFSNNSH